MRATLFDYGVGNLHSLAKALERAGAPVVIETDPARAVDAECLVLPGVGAFSVAAACLAPARDALRCRLAAGLPCLAICLGMQLLLGESEEGAGAGVGLVPGRVTRIVATRVPHMGWNPLLDCSEPLCRLSDLRTPYFANSYACRLDDPATATAWATHDHDRFPAALRVGRTVGVQFHPEKSSREGVAFLREFWQEASR